MSTQHKYQPSAELAVLHHELFSHPFWSNRLFEACRKGKLSKEDFRFVFSQYYAYSRSFTRYLSGVMASCPDDYLRARLSENLWEEGGGADPEQRHAELFRRFLVEALGIPEPKGLGFENFTRSFVAQYLAGTGTPDHVYAASFLSLGTEAIVSRMYQIFVDGMLAAGLEADKLEFFHIHIACDDGHAETLMMILDAARDEPGWLDRACRGMNDALEARRTFFEELYDAVERTRYEPLIDRVRAREVLAPQDAEPADYRSSLDEPLDSLYANTNERLGIDFTVERVRAPGAEVLDPRIVRIPPGRANERHRHAHETVFFIAQGSGEALVGDKTVAMSAGETVFIPRWAFHQTRNTGTEELVILAVTDFGLTSAVLGDYDRRQRLKHDGADATPELQPDSSSERPLRTARGGAASTQSL